MTDVEQMKKIVPFVTCEITFGLRVWELMFGIHVSNLSFGIKINPGKQPVQSNSVGPGYMSQCGTSACYHHLNHSFTVLKDIHHSIGTRKSRIRRHTVNVKQTRTVVRDWSFGLILRAFA